MRSRRPNQESGTLAVTTSSVPNEAQTLRVQAFYDQEPTRESWPWRHWSAHPRVTRAINRRISGDPAVALPGALARLLPRLGLKLPAARSCLLGCGRGRLDRTLARAGVVSNHLGIDLSPTPLAAATAAAQAAGLGRLSYQQGDLNQLSLPPASFDLILAEMSLHHVVRLEALYETIARALKPGGLFVIDEYAGPTRFQWSDRQMQVANALIELMPERLRRTPEGIRKPPIRREDESFFQRVDPSEAIRAGEVLPLLRDRFEVLWERPYGGTLLHPMLNEIAWAFTPGDLIAEQILDTAIHLEEQMEKSGELISDFVTLVARPR